MAGLAPEASPACKTVTGASGNFNFKIVFIRQLAYFCAR